MRRRIKSLIGFTMGATDGEIGKVIGFYFDDGTWTIRYLVVDTGNWLSGRIVLISPEALISPDWANKTFPINLNKDQIKNSPAINTELPVSRQEEMKLQKYYPWVQYWGDVYYGGGRDTLAINHGPIAMGLPRTKLSEEETNEEKHADKHLRSTKQVTGYHIKAIDGEIGDVEDFMVDETTWKMNYLMIDTGKWFPGKKVLLPPDKIKAIDWHTRTVAIDSTVEKIKQSPSYDPHEEFQEVYALVL